MLCHPILIALTVLSEQMVHALPIVSQLASTRTKQLFSAFPIFLTEYASAMVTACYWSIM